MNKEMISEEDKIELRSEEFQEILGRVPPWILRRGITVLASVVLILLVGSAVFKYPDVLSAQVVLTGSTPPASIVSRTSGKIAELYVSNNQEIEKGDYIAVIDNPAITDDILFLKNYLFSIRLDEESPFQLPERELRVGSLQSLYASLHTTLFEYLEYKRLSYFPQMITITEAQIYRHEAQYFNLQNQKKLTEEQFALAQSQFRRDSVLYTKDVISSEDLERAKNTYLQSLMSVENMHAALGNMQIQIAQQRASLLGMHQQDTEINNDLRSRIHSFVAQLKTDIHSWELMYVLQSPIDGTITFTNHWTENQNVQVGETVFTVVPHGSYEVMGKAQLPIARSGKMKIGQNVNIRLDNFPENEFGILRGVVSSISLVPMQAGETTYYTVEISLPNQLLTTYRKKLPWLPNMQGRADIITEDISLLGRFVAPIRKILSESL